MPQDRDVAALRAFLDGRAKRTTLGLMHGRRRIGKSTLLVEEVGQRGGFYFEATRVETPVHLERLGGALGEHLGVGRIELRSWEDALTQLLRLAGEQTIPVVLDEFGYLLEADPSLPSVIASTFGPGGRGSGGRARMVLCGPAIAMMRSLTAGEAALRGRAGLELVMLPDDYRVAATRLPGGVPWRRPLPPCILGAWSGTCGGRPTRSSAPRNASPSRSSCHPCSTRGWPPTTS